MTNELMFYLDSVATGVILACQYYMIRSSFRALKHVNDETFGRCIKNFIQWVGAGTIAGAWLLYSHIS